MLSVSQPHNVVRLNGLLSLPLLCDLVSPKDASQERGRSHGASQGNVAAFIAKDEKTLDQLDRANIVTKINGVFQTLAPTRHNWRRSGREATSSVNPVTAVNSALRPTGASAPTNDTVVNPTLVAA